MEEELYDCPFQRWERMADDECTFFCGLDLKLCSGYCLKDAIIRCIKSRDEFHEVTEEDLKKVKKRD